MPVVEAAPPAGSVDPLDKGLRRGSLGLRTSLLLALASTAPAYGIAAGVPELVREAGVSAVGLVLAAALPMLALVLTFREVNRHEPDAGTSFAWVSRSLGPRAGWFAGWATVVACVLVVGSLAQVAAVYGMVLVGAENLADNRLAQGALGLALLALLTALCQRGISVSARVQGGLVVAELALLLSFAVVALVRAGTADAPSTAAHVSADWLNPFGATGGLGAGLLVAVFLYWGWDTAFSLNEETTQPTRTPARAALLALLILACAFALVTAAVVAYLGPDATGDAGSDILSALGPDVLGSFGGRLMSLAVLTSALAGVATTVLPAARTILAMGVFGALPRPFARVDSDTSSPTTATWAVSGAAAVVFVGFLTVGTDALAESVEATALAVCVYYGLTAAAVPWYFRAHWGGVRDALLRLVVPALGAASMILLFVLSVRGLSRPDAGTSQVGGVATPVVVAAGALLLGILVMAVLHRRSPAFFAGRLAGPGDVVGDGRILLRDPEAAEGRDGS